MRISSYKMPHEEGIAPHIEADLLSIALCKPKMRKTKQRQVGDWIAGWTAKKVAGGYTYPEPQLIYLMQISEIVPTFAAYDAEHATRQDSIYRAVTERNGTVTYRRKGNELHCQHRKAQDLSGERILLAERFYYFGNQPLAIPADYMIDVPAGQAPYGIYTEGASADAFIDYVASQPLPEQPMPHSGPILCKDCSLADMLVSEAD